MSRKRTTRLKRNKPFVAKQVFGSMQAPLPATTTASVESGRTWFSTASRQKERAFRNTRKMARAYPGCTQNSFYTMTNSPTLSSQLKQDNLGRKRRAPNSLHQCTFLFVQAFSGVNNSFTKTERSLTPQHRKRMIKSTRGARLNTLISAHKWSDKCHLVWELNFETMGQLTLA